MWFVIVWYSHTDQRGEDDYNLRLSQCRAEGAMNYLVGKGISKSRITPVGFGESRLLKDCSTEEGCGQTGDTDCPCHQIQAARLFNLPNRSKNQSPGLVFAGLT